MKKKVTVPTLRAKLLAFTAWHCAVCLLGTMLLALGFSAYAQQPEKKVPRIGYLDFRSSDLKPFRQGLRDLDYIEGQNIAIEYRSAEGEIDRLAELAAELVRLKVDVIVTSSGQEALRAKKATSTIPIVMANSADAVRQRIVASLARPGGNVTGVTAGTPDLSGKRLELLKQAFPGVSRVGVLECHGFPGMDFSGARTLKETRIVAIALRVEILPLEVREPGDSSLALAFKEAITKRAEALLISNCPPAFPPRHTVDLAAGSRLPAIYPSGYYVVESGGLMSYGPDHAELFRRAALYVDRILKGAKPADLPVEQPTKFELVINLRTAKQLGLTIPSKVLMWADRVIE
ncbi:MAG TPA: ABC transporter substrate-binding protein [Candidatus Binatia bacterium]